jgi:hypothetical protein
VAVLLLLWLLGTAALAQPLPTFGNYKVPIYGGSTVPPLPPTPSDREVRCCAWADDRGAINFAGKYRLTLDTCGSECITIHVVDRTTGRHLVVGSYSYSYMFSLPKLPHGAEYRPDSRLLIVHGCPFEENCGTYYLLMNPNGLTSLKYVPFGIKSDAN